MEPLSALYMQTNLKYSKYLLAKLYFFLVTSLFTLRINKDPPTEALKSNKGLRSAMQCSFHPKMNIIFHVFNVTLC